MSNPPEIEAIIKSEMAWPMMADTSVCKEDLMFSRFIADTMVQNESSISLDKWLGWSDTSFRRIIGCFDFEVIKVYADSDAFKWMFGTLPDARPDLYVPLISLKRVIRRGFQWNNPYRANRFHVFKHMYLQQRSSALVGIRAIQYASIKTFLKNAYGKS